MFLLSTLRRRGRVSVGGSREDSQPSTELREESARKFRISARCDCSVALVDFDPSTMAATHFFRDHTESIGYRGL